MIYEPKIKENNIVYRSSLNVRKYITTFNLRRGRVEVGLSPQTPIGPLPQLFIVRRMQFLAIVLQNKIFAMILTLKTTKLWLKNGLKFGFEFITK